MIFCSLCVPITKIPLLYSHHHPPFRNQHAQYRQPAPRRKNKINADLAVSGIAYKERPRLSYDLYETKNQQPKRLCTYFRKRQGHYREAGKRFLCGFEYEKE
ncbi:DNA polymerase III subunit theta [Morganella morganii]|uniref:DNA polymerase III subunit theta n=1 Tax=Morganella morganii TaxID=582 RepID=UPI0030CB9DC9